MALRFYGIPLVWIKLANRLTDEDLALRKDFNQFLRANDIYPVVGGGADPGRAGDGYKPEDARKVITWLKEHGAEVDPSIGMS